MKVRESSPRYPSFEHWLKACDGDEILARDLYNQTVEAINNGEVMWDGKQLHLVKHEA